MNKKINISSRKKSFLCSKTSKMSKNFSKIEDASLNVLISRNINFRIDVINIINDKRTRRQQFANAIWTQKIQKILVFHTAFMIAIVTKQFESKIKTVSSSKFHISNLSKLFQHYKAMLRHSYAKKFRKATQIKYDAIENREIWQVIDKRENYKCKSLKWGFTYKIDFDEYLIKYKSRIVIRDDLQNVNNAQNVYVATLAAKYFRMMMTFVVDFHLKTR
jgi:hypothetical protein